MDMSVGSLRDQKKASDSLELEQQVDMSLLTSVLTIESPEEQHALTAESPGRAACTAC